MLLPGACKGQKAQQMRIDSMLKILPGMPNDSNKVKLLKDISGAYFTIDPKAGILYGKAGLALAQHIKWQQGIFLTYKSLGGNYLLENDNPYAIDCYLKCLRISEQIHSNDNLASIFHNLGITYMNLGNYPQALMYYEKALKIYENSPGNKLIVIGYLENMGRVYEDQRKHDTALKYFMKALKIAQDSLYKHNIAYISGELAECFLGKNDYQRSLEYHRNSLKMFEQLNDKVNIASQSGQIGMTYFLLHNYNSALEYFEKAIKLIKKVKGFAASGELGKYYGYMGQTYASIATDTGHIFSNFIITPKERKKYIENAVTCYKKAISLATSADDWGNVQYFFLGMSQLQVFKKDYLGALEAFKRYDVYKDSANNSDNYKEITRHEIEYEYSRQVDSSAYVDQLQKAQLKAELQKVQLDKLRLKQRWLYAILAIIVLCMISFYFFFRNRIQQIHFKNELSEEQIQKQLKEVQYEHRLNDLTFSALRSQMNPHFIFNALNTIQSFVYSNDKKSASNYLGKFSELIRKILDNSSKQTIMLTEEIEVLQLYIDIEKARFGDQLHTVIEVDSNINTEDVFIPPMLVQPYVENAIKHGLLHRMGQKNLIISINKSKDKKDIEIVIDDNGIGYEKSREINKKRNEHHSFANAANEQRINLFNKLFENKQRIEIIDKKNADGSSGGTRVTIKIPYTLSGVS